MKLGTKAKKSCEASLMRHACGPFLTHLFSSLVAEQEIPCCRGT